MVLELLPAPTSSLQFVTMNELKESMLGSFEPFTFYLIVLSSFYFVGIRSYFTQGHVCRKMGRMNLSIVEEYFSDEVTHNLRIIIMNNAPPKRFSVDFMRFKYSFSFSI